MHELTEKVDRLERAIMELVYIQHKTEMEIQSLKKEMKEFKDAIQKDTENLKREMKEFKDAIQRYIENLERKPKEFKDETKDFKDEMREEAKRMKRQWAELANKMGTIVEDIVFPATRPVIRKYFKCDPPDLMMNVERKRGKKREEFDVIAICEDKVFLIEVKSTLRQEHVGYIKEKAERFRELFPEYRNKDIVLILASLSIKKEVLNKLTRERIYGMAYREWEYMDLLNFEEVE